ncbi:hypothetical protein [Shewanella algae]|uniref:Uncharacterized protein n=1 Tax=Shewanella algae TaxID=38313 RepID=A0A379YX62_9GAMM|nr:hypothetical protein [Shewanella algae]MBO2606642.1 hypothetical protein [Shewanella algae]QHD52260.1 hypothetical protein GM320_03310 [Shewanella algae]SUI50795.1 Uncharacterised protein [Shewanella algae]
MENIVLQVNIEGMQDKVRTDWNSLADNLKKRGMDEVALNQLHTELCAGLRVSTRGLTLSMVSAETFNAALEGIISESRKQAQSQGVLRS